MFNRDGTDEVGLILSGVKILQQLDFETIRSVSKKIQVVRFKADENLVKRGEHGKRLYIIVSGDVEVRLPDKLENTYRCIQLSKGSVVGEVSLLTNKPYSADVVALTDTDCFYLERDDFNDLIDGYTDFAETMSSLMSERLAQNGGINQVRKYKLLDKIGEGSMAIVFNTYDPELERNVAVKMLKYELSHNKEFLTRFEREAKIIASLSHPNIVNVYEIIQEFSTSFMVMEKLRGKDLEKIIKENGPLSVVQTREILFQVASALRYAHGHGEHGIIHRDIKPSNIIIDEYGHVKLTDFGISGPPLKDDDIIVGTPSYLAPEIINNQVVDGRADIYAMGIMAFHMLTGRPPFKSSSLEKLLEMQLNQIPPSIRDIRPGVDMDMAVFIKKSLEKDAEKRISDWNMIRVLLKPGSQRDIAPYKSDEISFVVKLENTSYQQAASIINNFKKTLEEAELDHSIKLQRQDASS